MSRNWQQNDEKIQLFMENTNSLIAVFDGECRYEYVSPSHQRLLGFSSDELLGTSGLDLIHPQEIERLTKLLTKGVSGELDKIYGLKYRLLDKGRRTHFIEGNFDSIRDNQGNLKHLVFVGDDVTNLKYSEEELDKEKEKFRLLVEAFPLGVLLFNDAGRVVYVNSKFTEIFGYSIEDITTEEDWHTAAFPNTEYRQQILEFWKEGLRGGERESALSQNKYVVTCKDGSAKTVHFFHNILESSERLLVCQDITRQESIEAQFMHAQKMESIGRLASGIAHDFNNLLTTIIGNADFALMDLEMENPVYEVAREIKEAAERASALTRQLLTFSRKQSRHPESLNLNVKIRETEKMAKRLIGENITLELMLSPEIKLVEIDPGQVEQIIMNLVVNARDAMPRGGRLSIQTANVELSAEDPVSPIDLVPGEYVLFSMSDNGAGIPQEIQKHVFEPFFTTKEKGRGTGLGLSTVYGIVKQNRGNILIYSEPGKGTIVKIFFPIDTKKLSGERKDAGKEADLYGTETILLTEDEERVRKIVGIMLRRYGYTVLTAADGQEAIDLFKTTDKSVQLLLTDMVMPGMNGLDLARRLRKIRPGLKVICMSGYTDTALYEGIREEGFTFLNKPFAPKMLVGQIRALLDA